MRSMRLDAAMVERCTVVSRERAKEMIKAGHVKINGVTIQKPAANVAEKDHIEVSGNRSSSYVGRGYLKLEKAMNSFHINLSGMYCLDVGASTGGFTQLLLECGACKVTAVDVGTGQLAQVLRGDERVESLEKTDIRTVTREQIGAVSFACADVSFISLKLILPTLFSLLDETGSAVCLLKPQFEAGPQRIGKRGVVKDQNVHAAVIKRVLASAEDVGFSIGGMTHSPILGGEGNLEFLVYLHKNRQSVALPEIEQIVQTAWRELLA